MGWIKRGLAAGLCLLLACGAGGCREQGGVEGGGASLLAERRDPPVTEEPALPEGVPGLQVRCDTMAVRAIYSSAEWIRHTAGGDEVVRGNDIHPLNQGDLLPVLETVGGKAELDFEVPPSGFSVQRWSDESWGNAAAAAEKVTLDQGQFQVESGYIYEVSARFGGSDRYEGFADYAFFVKDPAASWSEAQIKEDFPKLKVRLGSEEIVSHTGNFYWYVGGRNGKAASVTDNEALGLKQYPALRHGGTGTLSFSLAPDAWRVERYALEEWLDQEASPEGEEVRSVGEDADEDAPREPVTDFSLTLEPGYLYRVYAGWTGTRSRGGNGSYLFYVSEEKEGQTHPEEGLGSEDARDEAYHEAGEPIEVWDDDWDEDWDEDWVE